MSQSTLPGVLDLFCGTGGFSEGFRQAGYRIVAGVDSDEAALITYKHNFPEADPILHDLSKLPDLRSGWFKAVARGGIDVIIGGPPCQGFSIAGKRQQGDPRNDLYKDYMAIVRNIDPQVVVIENVPTIRSLFGGAVAEAICSDLKDLKFSVLMFTLLASDYGVPQLRRRTFFVGVKRGPIFRVPAPTTAFSPVTCEAAIGDLPLLDDNPGDEVLSYGGNPENEYQAEMRRGTSSLFNHWAVMHTSRTKEIIAMVPDGGNYKDLPAKLHSTRKVNIAWTRMNSRKPCFTIDAGHNHHFHYKANRVPTVRECARIQSFPDRFRFFGNKTGQFRQVGNAVPPLLAKAIASELKVALA